MGLAEKGVVNLLADAIEHSNVVIRVLGASVTLDGIKAFITEFVEVGQELCFYHVVGIEDDHIVVVAFDLLQGILHRFGLTALLEDGLQEGDGQLCQLLIGFRLHVVGDNDYVEAFIGVVLS